MKAIKIFKTALRIVWGIVLFGVSLATVIGAFVWILTL